MKPRIKPRNPFVACAKFRNAGPRETPAKVQRRQDKLVLCEVVKQLPEHWHKRSFLEFASANASAPSGCGAVGSAPRLGRGGRWFETSHPDHFASLHFASLV